MLLTVSFSAFALTPEMNAYFRASTGGNFKGGRQECVTNTGSSGNEFRLGSECGIYGEIQFKAPLMKSENASSPYWKMATNFAFVYANKVDFESSANNWVLREIYTEGGNFDGMQFGVWVGKRFWRWADIHMLDLNPVDMSGPGGGILGMSSSLGTWSATVIQNSSSNEISGTSNITTKVGSAAKTSLHLQLDGLKSTVGDWSFWLATATTPQTNSSLANYKQGSGYMLASKNNTTLWGGDNELGLAVGTGILTSLSSQGELVKDCSTSTDASCNVLASNRIRFWDSWHWEGVKWSGQAAFVYDEMNRGTSTGTKLKWTSLGVQPIYWFTDHIGLASVWGVSQVLDEADGLGTRTLSRITIAPELALKKEYWARPVIRAYYTMNFWNNSAASSIASGTSAVADTQNYAWGLQTEVWF